MNVSRLALAATGAWCLFAGIAHAQIGQTTTAQAASLDYYYLQTAQPSPSDKAPAAQAPACDAAPRCGACRRLSSPVPSIGGRCAIFWPVQDRR